RIGTTTRGTGGSTGTITRLREQLVRLASSSIVVQSRVKRGSKERVRGGNQPLADEWELWFDSGNPDQTTIQDSYIQHTERFVDMIADAPIPIDLRILQQLGKPRAMDTDVWLTLRKDTLHHQIRESLTFSWDEMEHQFSTTELTTAAQRRNFRDEFKKCIDTIRALWPDVGVETDTKAGVTLHQGTPSVAMRKPRKQLP